MSSSWTFSTLEFLNCCLKFNWELKHDQSWCNCLHEEFVWRNKYRLKLPIVSSGNLAGDRKSASWNPLDFTLLVLKGCAKTLTAPDVDWNLEMTPVDFVSEAIVKMTQVNIVCLLPPPPATPQHKQSFRGSFVFILQNTILLVFCAATSLLFL